MQFLLLVVLLAPAVLANVAKIAYNQSPITLVYRPGGKAVTAQLSLDCAYGRAQDEFQLIVTANDKTLALSSSSFMELLDKNGRSIPRSRVEGSGDLVLTGRLNELSMDAVEKNCDGSGVANCGATRKGKLVIKQFFQVPGTISKLYWPGLYHVDFECRLMPLDPEGPKPLVTFYPNASIANCVKFHHVGTSWIEGPLTTRYLSFDFEQNVGKFQLESCTVRSSLGVNIPVMANGQILEVPTGQVTGRSVGGRRKYELKFEGFALSDGATNGVVNCRIASCRTEANNSNEKLPICSTGDIPRASGKPPVDMTHNVRQSATLEVGSVTQVVGGPSAGRDCPPV